VEGQRKSKVAFFLLRSPEESEQITGGTWSNLALLSSLERHDVLVIVNARDLLAHELERRGIRYTVIEEELSWRGARRDALTLATKLFKALAFNARVRALCAAEGVAVFQCDENAATFVGLGAKWSGSKLVVAYRNYPNVVPRMKPFYKLPMLIADRLVATSELLREVIVTQGWKSPAARTARIYNGIDVEKVMLELASRDRAATRAGLGIAASEVAIGVIGSIVPFKMQAELLAEVIAPHAEELRRCGARLHFLGGVKDEAYAERCRALVQEHGLTDLTAWTGYIPDMAPWFASLDIIAFPAPEGTARTLLEAAAYGVPAVARETSREVVVEGENGFLCRDVKDLAAPLLRLAGDAELRQRMGASGRRIADDRFDVRKNREAYARIYDALIARGR
jgi:glycosyltransferase involved in cell wall biosynthesis